MKRLTTLIAGLILGGLVLAAGLEHHVGVRKSDAGLLVGLSWLCFALMLWMVR